MNTHSVELSQFDLGKLARLTLEPGGALTAAIASVWPFRPPVGM